VRTNTWAINGDSVELAHDLTELEVFGFYIKCIPYASHTNGLGIVKMIWCAIF